MTDLGPVEIAFCDRLAEERRKQGLTVRELRDRSGVGLNTISRLERRLSRPSLGHCAQLAEALGYTLPAFLGGVDIAQVRLHAERLREWCRDDEATPTIAGSIIADLLAVLPPEGQP